MSPSEYRELVAFLGDRFEAIDRRFEAIDRRFEAIETQLGELRAEILGHFDDLYRRLERHEQEYTAIAQALRRIEAGLADERGRRERLERDLATLRENVAVLQARLDALEARLPPP
jgi:chromosome segregation ATPase